MRHFVSLTVVVMFILAASMVWGSTITGFVLDADSGDPIADARVRVMQRGHDGIHETAITGDDGSFLFEDVPAGEYHMDAGARGYEMVIADIEVAEDEVFEINFELDPLGELGDASIIGQVIDAETEEPLGNVHLVIHRRGRPHFQARTITDEMGNYVFEHVPAGEYVVNARLRDYEFARQSVEVVEGDPIEVNFALVPRGEPVFGGAAGVVIDAETNEPIADARVMIKRNRPYIPGHRPRVHVAVTDENGNYSFDEVPVGNYRLWSNALGYLRSHPVDVDVMENEITMVDFELIPYDVEPILGTVTGTVTDAETGEPIVEAFVRVIRPRPGHPGFLMAATDENGVYSLDVPVGTYDMRAGQRGYYPAMVEDVEIIENETITIDFVLNPCDSLGILGSFSSNITETSVEFLDETNGNPTNWLWTFGDGTTSTEQNPTHVYNEGGEYIVTLETWGNDGWDIEVQYLRTTTGVGTVTGVVTNAEDGTPIPRARVVLHRDREHYETHTNENGEFTLDGVEEGAYDLMVNAFGYMPFRMQGVEVIEGEITELDIQLTPREIGGRGTVAGVVTDAEDGTPIPRAHVVLHGNERPHETYTDENGTFTLIAEEGTYGLTVDAFGYERFEMEGVEVIEDETTELDIQLTPFEGSTLIVTVVNVDGGPIPDARVLLQIQRHPGFVGHTDENGQVIFEHLRPGRAALHVDAFGYEPYREQIEIVDGETLELTVELQLIGDPLEEGSVSGVVLDAESGEPLPQVMVGIRRIERPHFHTERFTDENGEFAINRAPVGEYVVHVMAREYEIYEEQFTVEAGENTELTIELVTMPEPTFGNVAGTVIDTKTNEPIVNARVHLYRRGHIPGRPMPRMHVAITNENGEYLFEDVMVQTYHLWAGARGYERSEPVEVEVVENETVIVDFALNPVDMDIPYGTVTGTVTDAESGEPIADAMVRVLRARIPGGAFATTDENGVYTIESRAGIFDMRAGLQGYYPELVEGVEIIEDGTVTVDFALSVCDSIGVMGEFSGRVVEEGLPMGVEFNDESEGSVTNWLWSFGNGETSTEQHPDYVYEESGVYTVTLEVWGPDGWDMQIRVDYVDVEQMLDVDDDNTVSVSVPNNPALSNYPNPFNPVTTISYEVPVDGQVKLSVYDVSGKLIWSGLNDFQSAGSYTVKWEGIDMQGRAVQSGVYLYRLETEAGSQTNTMILLK